ncbi:hypothetical protein [Deinococcus radiophilus]|uniref:Uncharacterized protein n=1 Tax=Deinococcus radiophilus TaxID=32062 RepID=A0A431VTJ5_9DEIO|nr:hypothetical protein [Deinococcus radiophilus]RTR26526.1 hypothetical protein EJ104_08240 [Deinococcus radiophilus]UFA50557.1 hypothetical protein LMT64_01165 [Deinococcus radiophilus]
MRQAQRNRLAEIRARLQAARPGPWEAWVEGPDDAGDSFIRIWDGERPVDLYLSGDSGLVPETDYEFIAHARADIEFLLGLLEEGGPE